MGVLLGALLASGAMAEKPPEVSHDGLMLVHDSKLQLVYLRAGTDFSHYTDVALLDCMVAFRRNWQRDQNRGGTFHVTKMDMDRISKSLAKMFNEIMREEIVTNGKLPLVQEASESTLILRPAIIDLDISAPASTSMGAGRGGQFSTSSGSMTLYLEIFDGLTGQILARVADRQTDRSARMNWHDSVTNTADAKRAIKAWAGALREGMQHAREIEVPVPTVEPAVE
jgi:hypothetical protein